jgi:hypothetical protein
MAPDTPRASSHPAGARHVAAAAEAELAATAVAPTVHMSCVIRRPCCRLPDHGSAVEFPCGQRQHGLLQQLQYHRWLQDKGCAALHGALVLRVAAPVC